jgi:hypothetical protein
MTHQITQLRLTLDVELETDSEELEQLTRQLWEELLELDVQAVDWMTGESTPAKAKAGDAITWGTLLLTLAASGGVFTALISVVQAWLTRHERCSITLEIEGDRLQITGISSAEQQQLIDAWVCRYRQ